MTTDQALVRFFERLASAAQEFVNEVRGPDEAPTDADEAGPPAGLGPRQEEIYAILAGAPDDGIPTAEISQAMGRYDVPNVYLTLRRLKEMGLAELVPGSRPQLWRLNQRQRGTAGPYLLAALQVRQGEWATSGDLSIAVKGSDTSARAVGRAAATLPDFPNPHRILRTGGVVPPEWHDRDGKGPEECRRRLQGEGVTFTSEGRAEPSSRVGWEEIRERLRRTGVAVPPAAEL